MKNKIKGIIIFLSLVLLLFVVSGWTNHLTQEQQSVKLAEYNRVKGLWEYYSEKCAKLEVQNNKLNMANESLRTIVIEIIGTKDGKVPGITTMHGLDSVLTIHNVPRNNTTKE